MKRESISIQKTHKGIWMKRFDDYETKYTRCSKREALETINNARAKGDVYSEGDENSTSWEVWGIWN
jgi:hypothetical protein